MPKKFLIIRLSSIGDIVQCMSVIDGIKNHYPDSEIHWFARKDMSSFIAMDKRIDKIWGFDRKEGLKGIIRASRLLKKENYDYVYDAHSNIRSNIMKMIILPLFRNLRASGPKYVLRSKERFKRLLLFRFGINRFPNPFKGAESYQQPLTKWKITDFSSDYSDWHFPSDFNVKFKDIINDNNLITLVPSANWEMKRWPVNHWKKLINILTDRKFLILAGPDDTFCEEIASAAPERVINFAGKTSLLESCYLVAHSNVVISADTGFMHAADLFGTPGIALMGPTAFGYPSGKSIEILEIPMDCRPCTKDGNGKCVREVWQDCMVSITPDMVADKVSILQKY